MDQAQKGGMTKTTNYHFSSPFLNLLGWHTWSTEEVISHLLLAELTSSESSTKESVRS